MTDKIPAEISEGLSDLRSTAVSLIRLQPNLSVAVICVLLGIAAILTSFPTKDGGATLAGALFGAAAAFIGSWVNETNRAEAEMAAEKRRNEVACAFFAPELARIIAHQVHIHDRLVANFGALSSKHERPNDTLVSLRPWNPVLYPGAVQFGNLSEVDARLLIEFYDSVHEVRELVDSWLESGTELDFNAVNFLMQKVQVSLRSGQSAGHRFCPGRQYDAIMPATGTLEAMIERSLDAGQKFMDAHLKRNGAA